MKGMKKLISIFLALAMTMSMITIPALAEEEAEIEKVVTDNTVLTEPFDVANEDEVDAGLYPYDEKTVLVKLEKRVSTLDVEGVASIEYLFKAKDGYWYTANLSDGTTPKEALEVLRSTGSILLAEYNFIYETDAQTLCDGEGFHEDVHKNPNHHKQWHLDSCGIQKSWKKRKDHNKNPGGDSGVIVAVIDTGVDYDHEDLKNNMWTNQGEVPGDGIDNDGNGYADDYYGVDIVAKKGNGDDDNGHGTHVAGIIAAANNNVGVVGIAYNTKIMAIKAGQASGYFLQDDVCKAINYARENGADVINMSFGGIATTIAVQDALEEAYTHSVLVAAAGNDGKANEDRSDAKPCYPAAYSFVLGVMSVDDYGVESSFTNYDAKGFNAVEYELYAPGNAITSTIPNDRYATWNGTSMAAPVVSGMAAVLRSEYDDPDKYPTKFIYGQLASTSDRHAECYDPNLHGMHNIPQIVNLYDALTKMPNPEISVSDYTTFDTSDISGSNNGDGTIDSGETIALGFELRNRWGMSENTIVTIDAISQADIPNPYVEFSADGKSFSNSASINYGSVGTYSTQDCGKIIENELWTGWENPFYVKVAKDAPNETILAINVNAVCENALDEDDINKYSSETVTINLIVKNGVILPQVIDEDMTLTKDNYYIIQNATVIEEGATVTVTEGTNIQFWTNDSTDPYADQYMAGLVVKGTLNCIGTEEEPVKIFPSDLMGQFRVEIYESGKGEINYYNTKLTNLHNGVGYSEYKKGFTRAENCEFNQNYKDIFYFRTLDGGNVTTRNFYDGTRILGNTAINCAFYKLGGYSGASIVGANCDGCIFVDSYISYFDSYTYENCVFYGNNNFWDNENIGGTSSMSPYTRYHSCTEVVKTVRNEATGKTYLQVGSYYDGTSMTGLHVKMMNKLAEYMGGNLLYTETEDELNFIKNSELLGAMGAVLNKDGGFEWLNGEKLGDFITINNSDSDYEALWINKNIVERKSQSNLYVYYIIELPGEIFIEEIALGETSVWMDTSYSYQLNPIIYPSEAAGEKLLYFSGNDAVATVDEKGLVTPVDEGEATIYVFSEDMQICSTMEVSVAREVKVTGISVPDKMYMDTGSSKSLNAIPMPSNHTKQISYKSSDESIVTVDKTGVIKAVGEGTATVTAFAENPDGTVEASAVVHSFPPATGIEAPEIIYMDLGNTKELGATVKPANVIKKTEYKSSDESIVSVNEDGAITSVTEGVAVITSTVFSDNNKLESNTTVYSYAPVTEITAQKEIEMNIGTEVPLNVAFVPSNSVKSIIYESDDESVALVDEAGNITAVSEGAATITATVFNDGGSLSTSTKVSVVIPVEKLQFDVGMLMCKPGERVNVNPVITPSDATNKKLIWDSSNPEIAFVNEEGELVGVAPGMATIKVTAENTDISAYIKAYIGEDAGEMADIVRVRHFGYSGSNPNVDLYYIITEDGQLRKWGQDRSTQYIVPTVFDIIFNGEKIEVADVVYSKASYGYNACVLDKNGDLYSQGLWEGSSLYSALEEKIASGVAKVITSEKYLQDDAFIGILKNGSILVMGSNQNGRLGIGGDISVVYSPVYVALESGEKVIDGYMRGYTAYLLTDEGNVYAAGAGYGDYFTKISEESEYFESVKAGEVNVKDGKAYYGENVLNLNNVKKSFYYEYKDRYFYVTENNELYFTPGVFSHMQSPEYVVMISAPVVDEVILREGDNNLTEVVYDDNGNITSSYLTEEKLTLGFNTSLIMKSNNYLITLKSGDIQYGITKKADLNDFTVSIPGGFEFGREYILTIPEGIFFNDSSAANKLITVNFIYEPTMGIVTPRNMHIDVGNTVAIKAEYEPSVTVTDVNYESSDENIVTVDEEGNVSPVSQGTAVVTARFFKGEEVVEKKITVYCCYPVTEITSPEEIQMELGATASMNVSVVPADTLKVIEYESSDETIATVDENGIITAVAKGSAIVTAKVKNDSGEISTETVVTVGIPVEALSFDKEYVITKLSEEWTVAPVISPENATIKTYKWESSDEDICYFDEEGNLVKTGVGTAVLKATSDYNDKIYDEIVIVVTTDNHENKNVLSVRSVYDISYALLEDGTVWKWEVPEYESWSGENKNIKWWHPIKQQVQFDGEIDDFWFRDGYNDPYILSDGTLYVGRWNNNTYADFNPAEWYDYDSGSYVICDNVTGIYEANGLLYMLLENGDVLKSYFGNTLTKIEDLSGVTDIYIDWRESNQTDFNVYFLSGNDLYITGQYNGVYSDAPRKIKNNISKISGMYAEVAGEDYRQFVLGDAADSEYTRISTNETLLPAGGYNNFVSYYTDDSDNLHYEYFYCNGAGDFNVNYQSGENVIDNVDKVFASGRNYSQFIPVSYYQTKDNQLFAFNWRYGNTPHPLVFGLEPECEAPYLDESGLNLTEVVFDDEGNIISSALWEDELKISFNTPIYDISSRGFFDSSNSFVQASWKENKKTVTVKPVEGFVSAETYNLTLYDVSNYLGETKTFRISFTYQPEEEFLLEDETELTRFSLMSADEGLDEHIHSFETEAVMPTTESEGRIVNTCGCGVVTETLLPKKILRDGFTEEDYLRAYNEFTEKGYNTNVSGNAILNRLIDNDITKWLRITAPSGEKKYGFGGNWWGTTNPELINHQIVDYNDYATLGDVVEGEFLTTAPENTFPFVTEAYLTDESGEVQNIVSGGKVKFIVKFNRDMDMDYGAKVFFGSSYPYAEYEIEGSFADARTWVGETELKTVIENGYQFIRVTNGRTAADENGNHLKLYDDWARFGFEIDTTSAMAMMMQGYADNDGIHLEWMQDDYDTLAGYSVYRAESEDGNYIRLNKTLIPAEENTFTDTDVEPGKRYYYTFKVVLTDATESKPAGKISVTAKDTMAPSVYHSPVYTATTGNKVIISATVSDNIGVQNAKLYYRVKGTDEWKTAEMSKSNSKYTASIPAAFVTLSGVEYYIAAFDGVNYTYAGSHTSENPYEITVYQAVENNAKGDIDGDGNITVLDALKLLRAIYDESLLTQEEFLRADINGDESLSAVEALRILQYANKTISSVLW